MIEYLEPEQAVAVARHVGLQIRDDGLLFSALARPRASAFGEDAYPTLELKAAALLDSVVRNHALFDGNKRFCLYLSIAFLRLNGYRVVMSNDEAFDLVLSAAQGTVTLEEIARMLKAHAVPAP